MTPTGTNRAEMPARNAELIEQMMLSQAYRELAAAHMFANALVHVPTVKWIKFMSWHIREEVDISPTAMGSSSSWLWRMARSTRCREAAASSR